MINRCARTLFKLSILALWLLPVTVRGQEINPSTGKSAHIQQEEKKAGESDKVSTGVTIKRAGNFHLAWHAPSVGQPPQSTSTAANLSGQGALSFSEAVQLAIDNNLRTLLARERRNEARGIERQSMAGLLPNVYGAASQTSITTNLAALGLTPSEFPVIPSTFIGPYKVFDARVYLVQSIFNLNSIRSYQAGRAGTHVAAITEELSRQQVIANTAIAYLNLLRTERAVEATQSDLELAQTLLNLAKDQHKAGLANGLDVTRAETRVSEQQFRLAQVKTDSYQSRLQLQRVAGLPVGGTLMLTDALAYTDAPALSPDEAVRIAQQERVDVRLAQEEVKLSDYQRRAAEAELLPSIDFVTDYGSSGVKPNVLDLPTRSIGVRLNVPIFNGGLSRGRITAANSRLRQAELRLNDLRAQVEEDVRLAIETLATAAEQVRAAEQSLLLAEREVRMARDRFGAGLGDNIEVVNAQTSLADARDAQVAALTAHNAARINLSFAMGRVESFRW